MLLALALACRPSDSPTSGPPDPPAPEPSTLRHSGAEGTGTTGLLAPHSAEVLHSGGGSTTGQCAGDPPPGPFPHLSSRRIRTEEDFDFDATGYLLTQATSALAGVTRGGDYQILVGDIGLDAAGIRSLPSGEVLVAQPDTGVVRRANLTTGSSVAVVTGLVNPNGLEVASTGASYVSEFLPNGRVREFDPMTGDHRVIAQLDGPNSMVLSPDELSLYVVTLDNARGTGAIVELEKGANGDWRRAGQVFASNTILGGLTVDLCGDLYVVEYLGGRVQRIRIPEGTVEPIAALPITYGNFSAMHFSPGLGGWSTTELYVTNRLDFFSIDVGVEGRHVLR